jgi:hypothetical protein
MATATLAPTAAGTVSVALQGRGYAIQGGTSSASVSTATNPVTVPCIAIVEVPCCGLAQSLSLVLGGTAASALNVSVSVVQL